jgi:hypothetical protein
VCDTKQTLADESRSVPFMRKFLQTLAISAVLLAPASAVYAQMNVGVRIGAPPAPRAYRVPPQPGPDYIWVEGYQYPQGSHYTWHDGYWTRPPYAGAYWVEPYHVGGQYFAGRWEGNRGNIAHDHRWDRGTQRDGGRDPRANVRNNGRR